MILGFTSAFVPQIIDGTKVHTIRSGSRWQVGQVIEFCTGSLPAATRRFRPDAQVLAIQTVQLTLVQQTICLELDGRPLRGQELLTFARRDGFDSPNLLGEFFAGHYGLPFTGQLLHWTDLRY